ncbi:alpha/beta fold hydrolase [Ruegeria sp. 2205SS24-7]|uniref:alpha/beta hydrolase family protein n=1 Tax=Ruegeria discodermiae TaxID=3064389 RepID=UPI002741205A|nr:alpha/beta fold hydrolase [Ruegeria sp. 2205SS24-7]MDP5219896.1 alpha/beta fold hydrolase [Ruegeria sp. 2205SS24-7]
MADLTIADPDGDRHLSGFIWYPTEATGPLSFDLESVVWESSQVIKDGDPAKGRFPLVVLSHGMYGNAYNQAWFANALARRGYVVAAVNHPGTSTWSRDPEVTRQLWERPKDISRVIDHATATPELAMMVDPARVFMAGHSLGGFTAIALAGARYDAARLNLVCAEMPDELTCNILSNWKVAQTDEDRVRMEADLSDPRISAFVVFDLGGTQSFSDTSLARIDRPLLIYGAPIMNSGLTLDIESRALRSAVAPGIARYVEPETLSHFDFLGRCKPGGYEILQKEEPGDEIICANGGARRAAKHEKIIEEAGSFFDDAKP